MTRGEWDSVVKRRLLAGWVLRSNDSIDDAAYFSWLKPYSLEAVSKALDSLAGTDWMPKANEIVGWIDAPGRQRMAELEEYAARWESRMRKAGRWLDPLVDPRTPVERGRA